MRILLSIGIASVALIVLWGLLVDGPLLSRVLVVALPVLGLLCMIRVFRTAEGGPPSWRYRDR
jgi:peptidoglycan/LPS O-acetylase OafA/YrhL